VQAFLSPRFYITFFILLGTVYLIGLFVPLMDNDSAHHANIGLHMYLTGDYISLVDKGKDYLDKPHFLFWLSALSYHVFGITSFAYKLPSFLFTVLGTYSVYRLGKIIYNHETGKLAALIVASSFAYILANSDVRMDAILTAAGIFATWQGVEWVNKKKLINALGFALGLAIGFSTKGYSGMIAPLLALFFYLLYKKEWKSIIHGHVLIIIFSFIILVLPVLVCYYIQFDMQPEKIIRGKQGWSGVKFILWQQNFERFQGNAFGTSGKNDYFLFFHSFLWAFAPWSFITYFAIFKRLKNWRDQHQEWLTTGTFLSIGLIISFAGYKLPHYINIIFPFAALLTANYLISQPVKKLKPLLTTQVIICSLSLLLVLGINTWGFPLRGIAVILGLVIFTGVGIFLLANSKTKLTRLVTLSVVSTALIFYMLNSNFYPQLLTYQAGNELAFATKDKINPKNVYYWPGLSSSAYSFYVHELQKDFTDSLSAGNDPIWVLTRKKLLPQLKEKGLPVLEILSAKDYEVDKLKLKFIDPKKRGATLDTVMMVRIK